MADNIAVTPGSGKNVRTVDIGGFQYQAILMADSAANIATVKAASTAAQATDTSFVVGLSPNSPLPAGTAVIGHVITDTNSVVAATGNVASGATDSGNPVKIGGKYNTTQPTVTDGQRVDIQSTARGAQIVATGTDTFNATINAALPAGTNLIGQVSNIGSVHLTSSPTVTAGAYTTGQVIGGLLSLSGATRTNSNSGIIQTVQVTVKTALTAPYDVFFFDTNPTNSTFTDNSALAINTADLPFLCGVAHCTDVVSGGTPQTLQAVNLAIPFKLSAAATTLYAVIVIRGGQTFASTSAIQASFLILQD